MTQTMNTQDRQQQMNQQGEPMPAGTHIADVDNHDAELQQMLQAGAICSGKQSFYAESMQNDHEQTHMLVDHHQQQASGVQQVVVQGTPVGCVASSAGNHANFVQAPAVDAGENNKPLLNTCATWLLVALLLTSLLELGVGAILFAFGVEFANTPLLNDFFRNINVSYSFYGQRYIAAANVGVNVVANPWLPGVPTGLLIPVGFLSLVLPALNLWMVKKTGVKVEYLIALVSIYGLQLLFLAVMHPLWLLSPVLFICCQAPHSLPTWLNLLLSLLIVASRYGLGTLAVMCMLRIRQGDAFGQVKDHPHYGKPLMRIVKDYVRFGWTRNETV